MISISPGVREVGKKEEDASDPRDMLFGREPFCVNVQFFDGAVIPAPGMRLEVSLSPPRSSGYTFVFDVSVARPLSPPPPPVNWGPKTWRRRLLPCPPEVGPQLEVEDPPVAEAAVEPVAGLLAPAIPPLLAMPPPIPLPMPPLVPPPIPLPMLLAMPPPMPLPMLLAIPPAGAGEEVMEEDPEGVVASHLPFL